MEGEEQETPAGQGPYRNGRRETPPTFSGAAASSCPTAWGPTALAPRAERVGNLMKWKLSSKQRTPGLSRTVPGWAPGDEASICFLASCLAPDISRLPGCEKRFSLHAQHGVVSQVTWIWKRNTRDGRPEGDPQE